MKTRRFAALLTFVSVAMILNACGGDNPSIPASSSDSVPESSTIHEEPVKLTGLFNKNSLTASFDTLEWLNQAEIAANVDITWQEVSADFDSVKGAMFAAGEAPDIMIRSVSNADLLTFEGLFADLSPYLTEENCPNIMSMLNDFPEIWGIITKTDGKIYGLPSFSEFDPETGNVVSGPVWINKQWLDTLGLELPTTWAEFENVMQMFKESDANGNGDSNDEIPFDMLQWRCNWSFLTMAAGTGVNLFAPPEDTLSQLYFAEDGVVKNLYADSRFKDFILWMRGMNEKGLVYADFFTKDYDTFVATARGEGTTAKVGAFISWAPAAHLGDALADQYVCCPLLAAYKDVLPGATFCCYGNTVEVNRVVLADSCANKEAALRFIDQFYDMTTNKTGFGIQAFYGGMNDIDKRLRIDEDGHVRQIVPTDGVTDLNTYVWQNAWVVYGPYCSRILPKDQRPLVYPDDKTLEEALELDPRTAETIAAGYNSAYSRLTPENVYWEPALTFSEEDLETLSFYNASWIGYVDSMIGPWITGVQDVNVEWDSYLETLESYGLNECIKIKQAAYDKWLAAQK